MAPDMIWFPAHHDAPLLKIPLLVLSTTLAIRAQTPKLKPTPDERSKYKQDIFSARWFIELLALSYRVSFWQRSDCTVILTSRKVVYCTNTICESAVILAAHRPGAPLTDRILPLLVRGPMGKILNVRITRWWLAGCALMVCGASLRLWCYRALGRFFTYELTVKKDHALVTSGPYAIVRHPAYAGSLLIGIGALMLHLSPGSWYRECVGWDTVWSKMLVGLWGIEVLGVPLGLTRRVNTEDEVLRREFGQTWDAYAKRTPYRLLPFVY